MRRILSVILIATLAIVLLTSAITKSKKGKQFRGTITYAMSYESSELSSAQISNLPTTQKIKMYDDMSMFDQANGPATLTYITNPTTDQFMVLIDGGERKAALVTSVKEMEAKQDSAKEYTTEIDFSDDTKIIAGYTCKKATVTFTPVEGVTSEELMFNVFYSPKLGNLKSNADGPYEGIDGQLLEFYDVNSRVVTKMIATEIKKGDVKDTDFSLPSDYKTFTAEQQNELMDYLQGK